MDRLPTLGPRGEGWVVIQVVLLAGVVLAGLSDVDEPAWGGPLRLLTTALGLALAAAGGWQVLNGRRDLGSNLTPLPHPTARAELVESGIYRRVRHPIYGGIILGGLAWGLASASPVALGLAILLVPLFWLKSTVEERWLEARFPGYPSYRTRTRRFIAWPG